MVFQKGRVLAQDGMDHFEVPSDVHHGEANLMAFDSSPYEVQRWRRYRFMLRIDLPLWSEV